MKMQIARSYRSFLDNIGVGWGEVGKCLKDFYILFFGGRGACCDFTVFHLTMYNCL